MSQDKKKLLSLCSFISLALLFWGGLALTDLVVFSVLTVLAGVSFGIFKSWYREIRVRNLIEKYVVNKWTEFHETIHFGIIFLFILSIICLGRIYYIDGYRLKIIKIKK